MPDPRSASTMIEGRVLRSAPNLIRVVFRDAPGDPFATAFTNGRTGRHRLTFADGTTLWVDSTAPARTDLERADGTALATITCADTSTAVGATAGTLFHFVPAPRDPVTKHRYRLSVLDRMGEEFARLDVVRTPDGWSTTHCADPHAQSHLWWERTGPALPVPILGTRLLLRRPPDRDERQVLLGACVDLTLGLRPYVLEMK
ncbi:hypothetical protein H0264_30485 [Nocardia huaxiensis]|uniref:Uncharacterized protein n=1 Tax=Nocardia huaxiensis TaxID=2755382 RepID=A0A7D6ZK25_9NOCA|nr:hypothetical protein [Nocardia huaxiensis]QLY29543.1 hypothetical protein H0264_30485 [Nocardia huaxiensis]